MENSMNCFLIFMKPFHGNFHELFSKFHEILHEIVNSTFNEVAYEYAPGPIYEKTGKISVISDCDKW